MTSSWAEPCRKETTPKPTLLKMKKYSVVFATTREMYSMAVLRNAAGEVPDLSFETLATLAPQDEVGPRTDPVAGSNAITRRPSGTVAGEISHLRKRPLPAAPTNSPPSATGSPRTSGAPGQ